MYPQASHRTYVMGGVSDFPVTVVRALPHFGHVGGGGVGGVGMTEPLTSSMPPE